MTNYHIKPPQDQPPYSYWQEVKEERRKVLEEVRRRRAERYKQFLTNLRLVNKQEG